MFSEIKRKYLFEPLFSEKVETFIIPIPKSKFEVSNGSKIAGGWRYFNELRIIQKKNNSYVEVLMPITKFLSSCKINGKKSFIIAEKKIDNILQKRPQFSTLDMSKQHIMGVINLTPDSFYKKSQKNNINLVKQTFKSMEYHGASIIDLGGESTRPGSKSISTSMEQYRVIKTIKNLKQHNFKSLISLDTRNFSTMKIGFDNGVDVINDISGFNDQEKIEFVSKNNIPIIIMHMQNTPNNMQVDPKYSFAPIDIYNFFSQKISLLLKMGLKKSNIVIDPGIGFGKTKLHNLHILKNLPIFHSLGVPLLIGISRKSLVGDLTCDDYQSRDINKKIISPSKRLSGSLAFAMHASRNGVQIIRTHDVFDTNQALICQRSLN